MRTTADLLKKALETKPAKFWADRYFIDRTTIAMSKKRGHLSPALAGNLAIDLGEDALRWIAVAQLEAERDHPLTDRLREMLNQTNR